MLLKLSCRSPLVPDPKMLKLWGLFGDCKKVHTTTGPFTWDSTLLSSGHLGQKGKDFSQDSTK